MRYGLAALVPSPGDLIESPPLDPAATAAPMPVAKRMPAGNKSTLGASGHRTATVGVSFREPVVTTSGGVENTTASCPLHTLVR